MKDTVILAKLFCAIERKYVLIFRFTLIKFEFVSASWTRYVRYEGYSRLRSAFGPNLVIELKPDSGTRMIAE